MDKQVLTLATVMAQTASGTDPMITITTGALDRMSDEVVPEGGDFSAYLRNPVVLFGHDHHALPVGMTTSLHVTGGGVQARWKWLEGDARAAAVKNAYEQGALRAASIGFQPREAVRNSRGGQRFLKWELCEWSLCAVPANSEATRVLRSLGLQSDRDDIALDVTGFTDAELARLGTGVNHRRSEPFGDPASRRASDVLPEGMTAGDLRTIVQGVVRATLVAAVEAETRRALNHARGRVD